VSELDIDITRGTLDKIWSQKKKKKKKKKKKT